MKPTKTSLVILLAATMLAGATGAVMATSGGPAAPAAAPVLAAATPTPAPSAGTKNRTGMKADDVLTGVLDSLVAKGTITAAQKQAILDGMPVERTARQAARRAAREQAKADRQQFKAFLADGVITKDEFDKLPANSPLRTLATLMDDGKITADELKTLGRGWNGIGKGGLGNGWGDGHGWGHGWGKGQNPGKVFPSASPTTGG